jgi:hypothetical protein
MNTFNFLFKLFIYMNLLEKIILESIPSINKLIN